MCVVRQTQRQTKRQRTVAWILVRTGACVQYRADVSSTREKKIEPTMIVVVNLERVLVRRPDRQTDKRRDSGQLRLS